MIVDIASYIDGLGKQLKSIASPDVYLAMHVQWAISCLYIVPCQGIYILQGVYTPYSYMYPKALYRRHHRGEAIVILGICSHVRKGPLIMRLYEALEEVDAVPG